MNQIKRNDPCPCGSGKKYKKCCGAQEQSPLAGLKAGIRMKGGVRYDEELDGFVPIVYTWQNVYCFGEPEEWRSLEVFSTEEEALHYYKTYIRPGLEQMMADIGNKMSDGAMYHQKLEE